MSRELLRQAIDALEEIALAGMSGTGQESPEGMTEWHARQAWKFIRIAARAMEPIRAELAKPEPVPVAWRVEVDGLWFHARDKDGLLTALRVKFGLSTVDLHPLPLYAIKEPK